MATVIGSAGDDLLTGTAGADSLSGAAGNDTLSSGAGNDTLDGGAGRDRALIDRSGSSNGVLAILLGPGLASTIAGAVLTGIEDLSFSAGSGDDSLVGGDGADSLAGGGGDDALQGGAGTDTLLGGVGADTLLAGLGADLLTGGSGADTFVLQGVAGVESNLAGISRILDFNLLEGDHLALRGQPVAGAVTPLLTASYALPGADPLPLGFGGSLAARSAPAAGLALPDTTGGAGILLWWLPDTASGGWLLLDADRNGSLGAADLVVRLDLAAGLAITAASFLPGSFATLGTPAGDALTGTTADDQILGLAGADSLSGLAGSDTLLGGPGDDGLFGGDGADSLDGDAGNDTLAGEAGQDVLVGDLGDDALNGGADDDLLQGGPGDDALLAGEGNDSLVGGPGADILVGGGGADTFTLQGIGEAAWSTLAAMDAVWDFSPAQGDRLRISDAWLGGGNGIGANAGTYTGADGIARPLVFSGTTGLAVTALAAGLALPAQPLAGLAAIQAFWIPASEAGAPAGGWLALDLDRDGRLGTTDFVARIGSAGVPVVLSATDFIEGTFLSLQAGGGVRGGTAGDDTLAGGSLTESFLGSLGNDRLAGGAGLGNTVSYASLAGTVALRLTAAGAGTVGKSAGGTDTLSDITGLSGTAGADTLDAAAAGSGFFATSLEGRGGNDRLVGNGTAGVQAAYGASPAAILVDLAAGTAQDGWGGADTLVDIRRVAATSAFNDTVLGSAGDDVFLSGGSGSRRFDGRAGRDEWRYAGLGDVAVRLAPTSIVDGGLSAYALKPGGTDRLAGIEVVVGGAGNDDILGSSADESLAGAAGDDTLDGAGGNDTVFYDAIVPGSDLPVIGVALNLATGTATDPWGGVDRLNGIENAWGTQLGDDLTGAGLAGTPSLLRGLAGNDTLRGPAAGSLTTADYAGDPAGVVVDLGSGTARDGWGGTDRLLLVDHVRGSGFADQLTGNAAANRLEGGAGDDLLQAGGGADTLQGGAGNDTLDGGDGADAIDGGPGADLVSGGAGDDTISVEGQADIVSEAAGGGYDTVVSTGSFGLYGNLEALVLAPGAGNLFGFGNALANAITGNEGDNGLLGGSGNDTLSGGDGADLLAGEAGDDSLDGGDGADCLVGGAGADLLVGGGGNDLGYGGDGADLLLGGDGNDALWGQDGADSLGGGDGADALYGGAGADVLDGGAGPDALWGEAGDDRLVGGADGFPDSLNGGAGNDTLDGASGFGEKDLLDGGPGDDAYLVDAAADAAFEADGGGNDTVYASVAGVAGGYYLPTNVENLVLLGSTNFGVGNAGANGIAGNAAFNLLIGADGNDTMDGGGGNDVLWGEAGADTFLFAPGSGRDTIGDFAPGQDRLQLSGFGIGSFAEAMAVATQTASQVVFTLNGGGDGIALTGVLLGQLSATDFAFG